MSKIIKIMSVAIVGIALVVWMRLSESPTSVTETRLRPVLVIPLHQSNMTEELQVSATVRARQRAQLAFSLPGRIVKRAVGVGDRVTEGQVLARLDAAQFRNARQGAKASHVEAKARLSQLNRDQQRVTALKTSQAVSQEEVEKVSAALESVQALVRGAEVRVVEANRLLMDTQMRAPFAGVITAAYVESGEYAQPGQTVLELTGEQELEVELELPESALSGLIVGASVDVSLPILGVDNIKGTIRSISHATSVGRLFPVIVSLEAHESLLAGVTAQVRLKRKERIGLSVPVGAIVSPSGEKTHVFRVSSEGIIESVSVVVTEIHNGSVFLEGALSSGDSIVVAGHSNLSEGQKVDARPLKDSPLHKEFSR